MFTVYGSPIARKMGEPRSFLLAEFPRKSDAISFAREAVNRHNIGHTCVVGRVTTVKEFFRYTLTDAERAEQGR